MRSPNISTQLPTFFVIGPPRTGTTWLHEVLSRRMQLPSKIKETRFFDVHYNRGWMWYRAHYPETSRFDIVGEVAPTYFASAPARERIVQAIAAPKIVCIFREPVARIESLYRAKCAYGISNCSFEQALLRDPELLDSSRYATHLKAWQSAVGKDRVLALIYDDLCAHPQAFLDRLADFIALERFVPAASEIRRVRVSAHMTRPRNYYCTHAAVRLANWCKCRGFHRVVAAVRNSPLSRLCLGGGPAFPPIPADTKTRLRNLLRFEIEELEILLNRDLAPWKDLAPVYPGLADSATVSLTRTEKPCA